MRWPAPGTRRTTTFRRLVVSTASSSGEGPPKCGASPRRTVTGTFTCPRRGASGTGSRAEAIAPYAAIGYRVLHTSVHAGMNIDALRDQLQGKISAFSGPSGVGKSSLLNAVQPGLQLKTGAVSVSGANVGKGRHTTVAPELLPLEHGGYVADTPGIREFGLWQLPPSELDKGFREFRPLIDECYYQPCSHMHEPDCAVQAAVERGDIYEARYNSYMRLYEELANEVAVR